MRLPNKVTSYKKSIISKFPIILKNIKKGNNNVLNLYSKNKRYFSDICEFVEVIDCLYALNKVSLDKGELQYVD